MNSILLNSTSLRLVLISNVWSSVPIQPFYLSLKGCSVLIALLSYGATSEAFQVSVSCSITLREVNFMLLWGFNLGALAEG